MITLRASPASSASTEATHPTKSLFSAPRRENATALRAELRSLSTRADITATSFVNTYEWGDFKGDPRTLMERYFDAH
ncbi:hypothetical protein F8271_32020, partial [Micromonospora sp. ALFpr18c]